MPLHDYRCSNCHYIWKDVLVQFLGREGNGSLRGVYGDEPTCALCGSAMERLPSAPNFRVKGFSVKNGYSK